MRTADNAIQKQDYATARRNYEQLSEFGMPEAKVALGKMYLHGDGVEVDPRKALILFQEAQAAGDNKVAPRLIPKAQAKIEAFDRRAARAQQHSHSDYQSPAKDSINRAG
jgi:TPR repeat protein